MNDRDLTQFLEEFSSWKSVNDTALEKISALCEQAENILGEKGQKVELEDTLRNEIQTSKNILQDLYDVNEGLEHVSQRNKILEKEVKDLTRENSKLKEKMRNEIDRKNEELKVQCQRSEAQMQTLKEKFNAEVDSRISILENKLAATNKENSRVLRAKEEEINDLVENIAKLREKAFQFKTSKVNEMRQRISTSVRNEYESKIQSLSEEIETLKEQVLFKGSDSQMKNETVSKYPSTSGHDSASGQKRSFKRKFYNPDESLLKPVKE